MFTFKKTDYWLEIAKFGKIYLPKAKFFDNIVKTLIAKVCYFTGRKTVSGNNRSHAMNQTKRAVKPNLQKVTVLIDGKPKKVWASARALKSGKVERV